jgi:adenosylhomocysteinase
MDGYRVMTIAKAAPIGDFFCTVTGDIHVIRQEHFAVMKDGAIVANSGHFNVELDLDGLGKITNKRREIREFVEECTLTNGRRLYVLGEGRLVNLSAAEGHPSSVMDMSFANQALCSAYMRANAAKLDKQVYAVPPAIDAEVARLKLSALGVSIDRLTKEQKAYLNTWTMGT